MPRNILILAICLCPAIFAFAQNPRADSLRRQAAALPAGKEKIETLFALSDALNPADAGAAMQAATEAYESARRVQDPERMIRACWKQAECSSNLFDYATAHRMVDESVRLATQLKDSTLLTDALCRKSDCFEIEGKIEESIRAGEYALAVGKKARCNLSMMAGRYCRVATNLGNIGQFDKAFQYGQYALDIYRQYKSFQGECFARTQLSIIYTKMGDHAAALEQQEKALEVARQHKDPYWETVSMHNCCDIQIRLGNLDKALELARHLGPLNQALKDPNADMEYYRMLGRIFYAMKDPVQAQVNFEKALALGEKMKNAPRLVPVWEDMTPVLLELGQGARAAAGLQNLARELAQVQDSSGLSLCWILLSTVEEAGGRIAEAGALLNHAAAYFDRKQMIEESAKLSARQAEFRLRASQAGPALEAARQSLAFYEKTNSKTGIAGAHLLLYRVYRQNADFENALFHHEKHLLYLDSIKTQDLRRRLAEERVKQNVETIETEKARAERENQLLATRNRLYLALGAALLLVLAAGAWFFIKLRKTNALLDAQNLQLAQLNQTKDKFFGIIAHDLRSPLVAFQGVGEQLNFFLEKGDLPRLRQIGTLLSQSAANLGALLDNLLSWALLNRGMIPYHPEPLALAPAVVENFQVYEHAAAAKGIRLVNNVPPGVRVQADHNALLAILRNLVGNAVKFTPAGQNGQIVVGCEERDGKVFITVNDTGTGIAAEKLDKLFHLEKRPEHGTAGEKGAGLGLILCRELVELHKGMLCVFSTLGKGSTFEFSLPKS